MDEPMRLEELPTNDEWSAASWAEVFDLSDPEYPDWPPSSGETRWHEAGPKGRRAAPLKPEELAEVVRFTASSPEGWGSRQLYAVARLIDGRWVAFTAWADTTGWGCQDGCDVTVGLTQEAVERFGLDDEGRAALGISADAGDDGGE